MKQISAACVLLAAYFFSVGCNRQTDTGLRNVGAHVHYPVSTDSRAAQTAFDEGLTLVYAYNRDQAEAAFRASAAADPRLALAYWGIALAQGPNINYPITKERTRAAQAALKQAQAADMHASPTERAMIAALADRFTDGFTDAERAQRYERAMDALADRYPANDDIQTLAAESLLDTVGAENLFHARFEPTPDTTKLVARLHTVLARSPRHIGANHYWIHVLDASGKSIEAMPSARYLSSLEFEPAASHLVHMGSHIFMQTGDWGRVLSDNDTAVALDESLAKSLHVSPQTLDYFEHNVDFAVGARLMLGKTAEVPAYIARLGDGSPDERMQYMLFMQDWSALRRFRDPGKEKVFAHAVWRYTRVMGDIAMRDRHALERDNGEFLADLPANAAHDRGALGLMLATEHGSYAFAHGDRTSGEADYAEAVVLRRAVPSDELPPWRYPIERQRNDALRASGFANG